MSKIGELITQYCPDGVDFKTLSEVGTFTRGNGLQKNDFVDEGVGCIHYGQIYTFYGTSARVTKSFVTPELAATLKKADPGDLVITTTSENLKDVCTAVAWLGDDPIAIGGHSCVFKHDLDPMYAAYYFQTEQFETQKRKFVTGTKVKEIKATNIGRIRIPVPDLIVQRSIAEILSKMEESQAELQTELQTELQSRAAQRTSYWNYILTPGDDWQRTAVGDIADVFDGPHATPRKTDNGPWYLSISSLRNGRIRLEESAHLSVEQLAAWTRRVAPQPGDTLFSYETRLGQAAYWDRDEPAALGRRMGLLRPKKSEVFPRFLTVAYLGPEFQALIRKKTVRGATVERIPIADMASWRISIPLIDRQKQIVSILDKVDDFVTEISTELSAEIEARRKQYEYYREMLLTFEERAT